ncbi:IS3 family transposase [Candidatus Chlorohelix allophototropha]|uniref:IS3 family transposase n=1 Tax=Candidatus Chlorohelix allophototropha TaxID=3003348 RepID=A0ABY9AYR7_9CHLR|nr:IS3 family transposase [Chloroflexota bacterium L227-S17]WJW69045.1 IS3 family transposase [Chloroflexota bacterium L227-S17]
MSVSRPNRLSLVEREESELALSTQAHLLQVARSSLYYQKTEPGDFEIELKRRIDLIYTDYPFYGSRRITCQLGQTGFAVNRRTVQRYMREMGLEAIAPGPNLSKRNHEHKVYPYLLRNIEASYANHVWGIDITYLPLRKSWAYLVAIIDWYSRYVVSWEVSETLEQPFVTRAVERALNRAQPVIFNSDQGSHFTSPHYTRLVEAAGSKVSMDGKGRALDNIFTERLWRSAKWENVYLADYANTAEATVGLGEYFDFYNNRRPHQSLDYQTPSRVYFG